MLQFLSCSIQANKTARKFTWKHFTFIRKSFQAVHKDTALVTQSPPYLIPTFSGILQADLCKKLLLQRAVKRDDPVDEQGGLNREGPRSLTSAQPMDETTEVLHLF